MTPDQSWLSVRANSVPGGLLFLLIPPMFWLADSSCLHVQACPWGGLLRSYLSDTWTPWQGSSLPVFMTVCCDAECLRRQALCIDRTKSCLELSNSRSGVNSGVWMYFWMKNSPHCFTTVSFPMRWHKGGRFEALVCCSGLLSPVVW